MVGTRGSFFGKRGVATEPPDSAPATLLAEPSAQPAHHRQAPGRRRFAQPLFVQMGQKSANTDVVYRVPIRIAGKRSGSPESP